MLALRILLEFPLRQAALRLFPGRLDLSGRTSQRSHIHFDFRTPYLFENAFEVGGDVFSVVGCRHVFVPLDGLYRPATLGMVMDFLGVYSLFG